jgi:hypothetical protein
MKIEEEILKHIVTSLPTSFDDETVAFREKAYNVEKIDNDAFVQLSSLLSHNKKVGFVDGGNVNLFSGASLSLDFIRVAGVVFDGKKYTVPVTLDFYVSTKIEERDDRLFFVSTLFFEDLTAKTYSGVCEELKKMENYLVVALDDEHLTMGKRNVSIGAVSGIARRFAELIVAKNIQSDVVVLDGSLECTYPGEEKYMTFLLSFSDVVSLAKTSQLLTTKGNAVSYVLRKLSPFEMWMYPVASVEKEFHRASVSFVRLHPQSKHIFRFECSPRLSSDGVKELLGLLSSDANDPVFFGYPYGLIKVDVVARIDNHEKEYLMTKFFAVAGKYAETLQQLMSSTNAHSVLDSISY